MFITIIFHFLVLHLVLITKKNKQIFKCKTNKKMKIKQTQIKMHEENF